MAKQNSTHHFQQIQHQLAEHLRDPKHYPPPEGLEDRRLNIYRRLFFKNISSFINRGFPVLRRLYQTSDWQDLIRSFYAHHQCQSPYFAKIAKEFVRYLDSEHKMRPCDPPYLSELAHYEYIELELSIATVSIDDSMINPDGDLLKGHPALSPLLQWHGYHWKVQQISPDYQPTKPETEINWIAVWRDFKNKVRFLCVTRGTVMLFDYLLKNPKTNGHDAILAVAQQHGHSNTEIALNNGRLLLETLRQKNIVLGIYQNNQ